MVKNLPQESDIFKLKTFRKELQKIKLIWCFIPPQNNQTLKINHYKRNQSKLNKGSVVLLADFWKLFIQDKNILSLETKIDLNTSKTQTMTIRFSDKAERQEEVSN